MYSQQSPSLRPWRQIALEVSSENDPERFAELVQELTEALDEQRPCKGLRVVTTLERPSIHRTPVTPRYE
jgi:hypothetical protein